MYSVLKRRLYEATLCRCFAASSERGVKTSYLVAQRRDQPRFRESCMIGSVLIKWRKLRIKWEKLHDSYSPEQLRSRAHLYIMKKHDSLDTPPDKPVWKGTSSKNLVVQYVSPSSYWKGLLPEGNVSVDQFLKWRKLLNKLKGAITKEQYNDFQSTTMEGVKNFWWRKK